MAHTHNHPHHEDYHHGADRGASGRRLTWVLGLIVSYMVAEIVGGLLSGSLALIADAGHMLSDAGALIITLVAFRVARRPASTTHTFGYQRAEILGALINGAALLGIAGFVLVGAYRRIAAPVEVEGVTMLAVAAGGLVVNLVALKLLHGGAKDNLNMRGAFLHVVADTAGSVGAVTAGALILGFGWHWADPVASVLIGLLVVVSAVSLLRQTVGVLMQAVPLEIDLSELEDAIADVTGVVAVHDLHVWSITRGRSIMTAHVELDAGVERGATVAVIEAIAAGRFGLEHVTIQLDCPEGCAPCDPEQNEGRRQAPLGVI